mgnify:CR=1 FL=1
MAVPSTNVKFSDIYAEANGGYTSGMLSMLTMSFFSYFAGPNGSNSQPANNWGQGEGSGANRIYGTSAKTTNIQVNDFKGLTYFYDNSTYQVTLNVTNNKTNPPPFPPPPVDNAVNVSVSLYDYYTFSYQYLSGGGMANALSTYGPTSISQTNDPIIYRGYWAMTINGANPTFAGGTANLSINGVNYFTGQAVNGAGAPTTFNFGTYGYPQLNSGYSGFDFVLTIY